MHTILRNSAEIKKKLRQMFCRETRNHRRIIVVAYVGKEAPNLLPDYSGVSLYCWPQVGSTNPYAISKLLKMGDPPKIYFVDRLHMKIYWVDRIGYVITSANLSENALEQNRLHEFGIFVSDSNEIEIDKVIDKLTSRKPTRREIAELQRKHDLFWHRNTDTGKSTANKGGCRAVTFDEWYRDRKCTRNWRLGTCSDNDTNEHKKGVDRLYPGNSDYLPCKRNEYEVGDWILCSVKGRNPEWLFVDEIVPDDPETKDKGYNYLALQRWRSHSGPFRLDTQFKQAFRKSFRGKGDQIYETHVDAQLLKSLKANYRRR